MFRCKLGGVLSGGGESMEDSEGVDAAEEVGVDGSDILLHAVDVDIRAFLVPFKPVAKSRVVRRRGGLDGAMKKKTRRLSTQTNLLTTSFMCRLSGRKQYSTSFSLFCL